MAKKMLLAALTTTRGEGDDEKKVRFAAKTVQNLTKDEIELLDKLTASTGRPHYRDPVNEDAPEDGPEVETSTAFDGENVAMEDKTVAHLKAYLDHNKVAYDATDTKPDLLKKAQGHASNGGL